MMKTVWKVVIVSGEELEKYLNAGWFLEKFEVLKQEGCGLPNMSVFAVLSKNVLD